MNHHVVVGPASVPVQSAKFQSYKRHLPHWRNQGSTYFTTWRLHKRQSDLIPEERDIVLATLKYFQGTRYPLHACVVMNDHVHALVEPCDDFALQTIVHTWKSFSTREMQQVYRRVGAVWQREYFDRIVRNELEFQEKLDYVMGNPFKRWPELTEYQWLDWTGTEAGPTTKASLGWEKG